MSKREANDGIATANHEMDQGDYVKQQASPDTNGNTHDATETKRSMFTRLKEMIIRLFLPKCFVYPFLAVVVIVVTVVMMIEFVKRDDTEIPQITIKDYSDTNTTSVPTTTTTTTTTFNESLSSPSPTESPM